MTTPHHSLNSTNTVENANGYDQESPLHQIFNNNVVVPEVNNVVAATSYNDNNVGLSWDEWPFEFPVGYRFLPEDEELIVYYLMRKIRNLKLPYDKIKDVDLYHTTPDEVTAEYEPVGDNKWYFFTSRKKKYRNGRRPDRSTGSGYWKATGADKPIKFRHQVVGYKNSLVFYQGKPPNGPRTNWIMHEFRVEQISERKKTHENDMTLDDWVLCRIYKKNDNKASSSSRNPTISVEDNNCHTQPKPELVEVDDEKPPQPIDSIEDCMEKDQDYYYIMYGQTPEYYFNNYNVSLLDSSNPGVNDNVYHSNPGVNDGQNGFFNSYEANPSGYSMNPAPHYTMDSLETWSIFKSCHQSYL